MISTLFWWHRYVNHIVMYRYLKINTCQANPGKEKKRDVDHSSKIRNKDLPKVVYRHRGTEFFNSDNCDLNNCCFRTTCCLSIGKTLCAVTSV